MQNLKTDSSAVSSAHLDEAVLGDRFVHDLVHQNPQVFLGVHQTGHQGTQRVCIKACFPKTDGLRLAALRAKNKATTVHPMFAIVLPGRKSGFRAGVRPDSDRETLKIGPLASLRPAEGPIWRLSRLESS